MKGLQECIFETLNHSIKLSKIIEDLESIGFKCLERTDKRSIETQSAYFGYNDPTLFDKINSKMFFYNYYFVGGWENKNNDPNIRFSDYKYCN